MEFKIEEWNIEKLLDIYEQGILDLNPPYQRNDIWPLTNKKRLIDSIKNGYPLPMFFVFQKEDGFEMVDGQQRTRTLIGYKKDLFPDLNKTKYSNSDKNIINKFKIGVTIINNVADVKILTEFYYRVNKFGTKLNRPEISKAQYYDTPLQNLIMDLADNEDFQNLGLFSEPSLKRMNDYDLIAELLALIKYGITDKKIYVDKLYEDPTFSEEDASFLKEEFLEILEKIKELNKVFPLKVTRYRQRNDIYTLWSFLITHKTIIHEVLIYFYKLLVIIDSDIKPSTEECFAFQEYATNCVSQSNSKKARDERLKFFEQFLLNTFSDPLSSNENEIMKDVLEFYKLSAGDLVCIDNRYYLPNIETLNSKVKTPINF